MPQDSEEGFRVTDRRRRDDEEPPRREAAPPEATRPGGASSEAAATARRPAPPEERSLNGLFVMLATEAVIALGDEADPATGERRQDLSHATEAIDLLLLLRDKTEGNRTAEESQLLEDLVYDLQLRYVRATKSAG
jgi:hypothetical protein